MFVTCVTLKGNTSKTIVVGSTTVQSRKQKQKLYDVKQIRKVVLTYVTCLFSACSEGVGSTG
ncbi:hypothetical protein HanPI659440_Chr17g0675731 [Helianthus annuus]|nr:hypothetical protein HanIR_Chr04g0168031 [Helianthus annuus]KAJ0667249.1 hypothetical protein HanPI659440_Chr17g0675731 [Helianthus annuus]